MKKEIKIIGTGNDSFLYRYEIEKKELTSKKFISFMEKLGFSQDDVSREFYSYWTEEREDWYKDFSKRENGLFRIKNKNFDVEVICFKEGNLYLIIRTKEKKKLTEQINKYFKFRYEP